MPEPTKRPLTSGQFVWIVSKKDGVTRVIFGPDPLEATDDDIFMVPDPRDPERMMSVEGNDGTKAIQNFVVLKPGQYAVITNPTDNFTDENPNGGYQKGRQEAKSLNFGKQRVVISGQFPIWPRQQVEVFSAPKLSASQFLTVQVEDADVDPDAPYYDLTVKCAKIRKAVVDEGVEAKDGDEKLTVSDLASASDEGSGTSEVGEEDTSDESTPTTSDEPAPQAPDKPIFQVGQRIIIPGSLTPTYIPPSGIVIVKNEDDSQDGSEGITDPDEYVWEMIRQGVLKIENLKSIMVEMGIGDHFVQINRYYTDLRESGEQRDALKRAIKEVINPRSNSRIFSQMASLLQQRQRQASADGVVRQAVVLGPTEFCVLLDEDGKPQTKQGPGRVFPGPNDRFRTEGSRDRVYDAYHLRSDRGILLRVVADNLSREELNKQLPKGTKLDEGKESFQKGDEVFVGGIDAYLVPSNDIEVVNPTTRQPHIGNDHSQVYVAAVGVDQKSGVYVAEVNTGEVELVRGEKKLLLDPRSKKHIKRRVPGRLWNLTIGAGEPHKKVSNDEMVETPWALSVVVPNNEAVLVTSKDGRRVVIGPKTELLAYEEVLEVLTLSRGRPKSDTNLLETCFLRVQGNRITDQVTLETSDYVQLVVDVSYTVHFVGENDEDRERWFDYRDYVALLCEQTRSRLRAAAKKVSMVELYGQVADFVRDTLLGEKPEEGGRPNLKFDENNMVLVDVDLLSIEIPDEEVAASLEDAHRGIVTLQIKDTAEEVALESAHRAEERAKKRAEMDKAAADRQHQARMEQIERENKQGTVSDENDRKRRKATESFEDELLKQRLAREKLKREQAKELNEDDREALIVFRQGLMEIETKLIETGAEAEAKKISAWSDKLVAAIEGLGDKQALAALVEHLPEATGDLGFLFKMGGFAGLKKMLEGTPLATAIDSLRATSKEVRDDGEDALDEGTDDPEAPPTEPSDLDRDED